MARLWMFRRRLKSRLFEVASLAIVVGAAVAVPAWLVRQSRLNSELVREACYGNIGTVRKLLAAGASPNSHDVSIDPSDLDGDSDAPALLQAIDYAHPDVAELLLDWGADPTARGSMGETSVRAAKSMGFDRLAKRLTDACATRLRERR